MPSSQENDITFTLSFGGVEFSLAPASGGGHRSNDDYIAVMPPCAVVSVTKICNGEVTIDLNGFVGTLRVTKGRGDVVTTASTPPSTVTTEGLIGNDDDEDLTTRASHDETSDAAAVAAAATTTTAAGPNPVEDTPSPNAKSRVGGVEAEVEADDEEETATKAGRRTRNKKGQQKTLDFFGRRNENKRGRDGIDTVKVGVAKRRRVVPEDMVASDFRKKSRISDESTRDDVAEFEDLIEETENDYAGGDNAPTTLASLGQTMPSQNESSSMGECDDGSFIDNNTMASSYAVKSSVSTSTSTAVPCPRWGHTMTMIDHRRFVVYGGQTIDRGDEMPRTIADLYVHDLEDGSWSRPINCDGVARTWHTANFLPERRLLICFGGEVLDDATGKLTTTDQVMVLDTEIMLWYPPTVSGQIPSGRSGHASCFLPDTNELVVFGGVKNGKWLNSVAVLDTNRWRWSTPKAIGDAPRPRSYHSATVICGDGQSSSRVVIFGGNDGTGCFNGVHVLEATSPIVEGGGGSRRWIWSNPKCMGEAPSPRTGHVSALLNDGTTIMVYGGWDPNTDVVGENDGDDLIYGDSYLLDTKTWTWKVGPRPRYEGGGRSSKGSTVHPTKNGGAERVGHTAVLAPGGINGVQVLAFGGRVQGGEFVGDFQSLIA